MNATSQLDESCALCQTQGQESDVEAVNSLLRLSWLVQFGSVSLLGALMGLVTWINSDSLLLCVCTKALVSMTLQCNQAQLVVSVVFPWNCTHRM